MALTTTDFDNAEIDLQTTSIVANSKTLAGGATDTTITRLGDTSDTLNGRLKKLGYIPPIAYAGGIVFTALDNVKTVDESGSRYAPKVGELPFTTSGTWVGGDEDKFYLIEGARVPQLSAEFADISNLVGATSLNVGTVDWSVYEDREVNVVVNNTTSKEGGAPYIIKTVAQAATDGDVIDGTVAPNYYGANHALDGGTHVAVLRGEYLSEPLCYGLTNSNDAAVILSMVLAQTRTPVLSSPQNFLTPVVISSKFRLQSDSPNSLTTVPVDPATPAIDVQVGGIVREKSRIEHFDFSGVGQCIKVALTNPIELYDIRFNTGKDALVMSELFYGSARDIEFQSSGVNLDNVNNFEFVGNDSRGSDAPSRYDAADFANVINDCDGVSFENMTFEQWDHCGVFDINESKNITFKKVWWESNEAPVMIKCTTTQSINFIGGGTLELFPSPSTSFIETYGTVISGPARDLKTLIVVKDQYLRLNNSHTSNFNFVNAITGSAFVVMDSVTLRNGSLVVTKNCDVSLSNIVMSTTTGGVDELKFLESTPNATISAEFNSWCDESLSADWDFGAGANFTELVTSALTITTTTTSVDVLTGTTSASITGLPSDSTEYVIQRNMSDMGPTSIDGETFLIFIRLKTSESIDIQFVIEGLFAEFQFTPVIESKDGKWVDYIFKTDSAATFAQGISGNPKIKIKMTNSSGSVCDLIIDRIDYKIVQGDIYLP